MRERRNARDRGGFPSGQRGQTVNLMALPSKVRILHPPFGIAVGVTAPEIDFRTPREVGELGRLPVLVSWRV